MPESVLLLGQQVRHCVTCRHPAGSDATLDGTRKEVFTELSTVPPLIIDDLGMRKLPPTAAEDLLELIMRRYERASTILTSNRPFDDWWQYQTHCGGRDEWPLPVSHRPRQTVRSRGGDREAVGAVIVSGRSCPQGPMRLADKGTITTIEV
ncbi:MAG: ATP-binding protein [Phycisphaerae bacterium]|nr:ATP-binding protein [Gemmatimonadaceae bacterium]